MIWACYRAVRCNLCPWEWPKDFHCHPARGHCGSLINYCKIFTYGRCYHNYCSEDENLRINYRMKPSLRSARGGEKSLSMIH